MKRATAFVTAWLAAGCLQAWEMGQEIDSGEYARRMAQEHEGDRPIAAATAEAEGAAVVPIITREVQYAELGRDQIRGFLAYPESGASKVGVIVIQEWWGLNDNIRVMAGRLAAEGYIALAVDLYEGEVAQDRDTAMKLMSRAMDHADRLDDNLRQARAYLEELGVDRVGVVGWCFGGGWSLRTALLLGERIDAAIVYYGRLVTDREELARLSAPLLGHFGSEDRGIPVTEVRQFEAALQELNKPAEIHLYEGANHAFANPSGTRYDEIAAELAWGRTLEFFASHLKMDG